jgi:hypothetical protein
MKRAAVGWVLALCGVAGPSRAQTEPNASATPRVSLVWILGDDDVLVGAAPTSEVSPAASIGDRTAFDGLFEGLNSRFTGRENRLELRLAAQAPGFFRDVTTRAEAVLGLDASQVGDREGSFRLEDAGSFVEASAQIGGPALSLRLFPLDGDRERVGTLEALGFGGRTGPERLSPYSAARGPVRAGRIGFDWGGTHGFVGVKTATFLEPAPDGPAREETSYGLYAGFEARPRRWLGFGLGFGHFEHGFLPGAGAPIGRAITTGGSARLSLQSGLDAPRAPVSFGIEPPPFSDGSAYPPHQRQRTSGFAFGVEGVHLLQRLRDFDRPARARLAGARAAALLGTVRTGIFELRTALLAREAGFVARNVPGVLPGFARPRAAREAAELSALASGTWSLGRAWDVSLSLGARRPAALLVPAVDSAGRPSGAAIVLNENGELALLPPGESPVPVLALRPSLGLRISALLETGLWLDYRRDFNRTRLIQTDTGTLSRGFTRPDRLGYGFSARAVW